MKKLIKIMIAVFGVMFCIVGSGFGVVAMEVADVDVHVPGRPRLEIRPREEVRSALVRSRQIKQYNFR